MPLRGAAMALVLVVLLAACASPAPSVSPPAPSVGPSTVPDASAVALASPSATAVPTPSPVPSGPLPGNLLIADRGNGRLLIVDPSGTILWSLTLNRQAGWSQAPLAADDAFFTADGRQISINAEDEHVIARVDIATRRIVWSYGHDGVPGSRAGYLNTPDDAYPLPNGDTLVADIFNERILEISPAGRIVRQIGTTRVRRHDPPTAFAAPNGDTPLPDGGILVTEIGGSWVDRLTASGALAWSVQLKGIHYPSDAQLLPNGKILVVDYHSPGAVDVFRRRWHAGLELPRHERGGPPRASVARGAAPERELRGHRRRQQPRGRDRSGDREDRLAVRTSRRGRYGTRLPQRARRAGLRRAGGPPSVLTRPSILRGHEPHDRAGCRADAPRHRGAGPRVRLDRGLDRHAERGRPLARLLAGAPDRAVGLLHWARRSSVAASIAAFAPGWPSPGPSCSAPASGCCTRA